MTICDYEWFAEQHRKQMEGKKCARCGCDAWIMFKIGEDKDSPTYPVCKGCLDNLKDVEEGVREIFLAGNSDFFIGCKAEEIPQLREAFSNVGLDNLVQYLDKMAENGVGKDRTGWEGEE